jgi:hypothetical protein
MPRAASRRRCPPGSPTVPRHFHPNPPRRRHVAGSLLRSRQLSTGTQAQRLAQRAHHHRGQLSSLAPDLRSVVPRQVPPCGKRRRRAAAAVEMQRRLTRIAGLNRQTIAVSRSVANVHCAASAVRGQRFSRLLVLGTPVVKQLAVLVNLRCISAAAPAAPAAAAAAAPRGRKRCNETSFIALCPSDDRPAPDRGKATGGAALGLRRRNFPDPLAALPAANFLPGTWPLPRLYRPTSSGP